MRGALRLAVFSLFVTSLAACDEEKPTPREQQPLVLPTGQSALDSLISKSAESKKPVTPGRLEARPARLDFRPVMAGQSVSDQFQLHNAGPEKSILRSLHVAGQAAAFQLGGSCRDGSELAPDDSCTVTIMFRPFRDGPADGELVVEQETGGQSLFVSLAGLALPASDQRSNLTAKASAAQASLIFARLRLDGKLVVEGAAVKGAAERRIKDIDYHEAGLPGIISTFPVDRSRVITADRYIPAVLENSIDSQLPGRAIAVVESNIFGSDDRLVLIPAGSRVIGRYQSLGKAGQARLDINWSRIIRPDGGSINVDFTAADVMGRAGIPGDLDNRLFEKYGASLLTSVIAAAGVWAMGGNGTAVTSPLGGTTQTMSSAAQAANRLGNDLDQLGQRIVQDNVDIRPVLIVPQGTRLTIVPTEDIWLRDPDRLQTATPPKAHALQTKADNLTQLLPSLVELLAQNPAVQRVAPQTAQQILQSTLLQQLQAAQDAPPASANTVKQPNAARGSAPTTMPEQSQ